MKGFGIEVKNDLLEKKHLDQMGSSVWLYMWFLDKMTSISEEGVGKILGGKPIKYVEVSDELGVTEKTYHRWVSILRKNGYINTRRTPYGVVFSVNKAYKNFGKRTDKNVLSEDADRTKMSYPDRTKMSETKKTDQKRQDNKEIYATGVAENNMIDLFKSVNPNHLNLFKRKNQHDAIKRMIKIHGEEKMNAIILFLPKNNSSPYAPRITTPIQLEEKMGELVAYWQQEKQKSKKIDIGIIV